MLLSDLKPSHDYGKEGTYLILKLRKKKNIYVEVAFDWFDYNQGDTLQWLIVRRYNPNNGNRKKYTNYKFENIHEHIRVVKKEGDLLCI